MGRGVSRSSNNKDYKIKITYKHSRATGIKQIRHYASSGSGATELGLYIYRFRGFRSYRIGYRRACGNYRIRVIEV